MPASERCPGQPKAGHGKLFHSVPASSLSVMDATIPAMSGCVLPAYPATSNSQNVFRSKSWLGLALKKTDRIILIWIPPFVLSGELLPSQFPMLWQCGVMFQGSGFHRVSLCEGAVVFVVFRLILLKE
jgi:hypothetical protein